MSKWIKKGDKVIVISGNDKGKIGKVLLRKEDRLIVEGINVRKKHMKKQQKMQVSKIVDIETPIHISNVALCSSTGKPIYVKVSFSNGGKNLIYIEDGKEVVLRSLKKEKAETKTEKRSEKRESKKSKSKVNTEKRGEVLEESSMATESEEVKENKIPVKKAAKAKIKREKTSKDKTE